MFLSKCVIKKQKASGLLSSLGIKIPILRKIPIVDNILFKDIK